MAIIGKLQMLRNQKGFHPRSTYVVSTQMPETPKVIVKLLEPDTYYLNQL